MEPLNNLVDSINLDNLIDSSDTCYVWSYSSYKPSLRIWHCKGLINKDDYPKKDNYKLWLCFFCDYIGYDVLIYYPENQNNLEPIRVLFVGAKIQGFINWIHGDSGLFGEVILPLLFLEKSIKLCDYLTPHKATTRTPITKAELKK
jgi:hypothetical protein